ncbi:MAG: sugar ABC transporter permease [Anaerolineae bacterium]|nr:sugar ABC transporter permease [Anaerolineae bacterium]
MENIQLTNPARTRSSTNTQSRPRGLLKYWREYLCISPFFILFVIFFAYPIGWSLVLSFQSWDGIGEPRWVGVENYQFLLSDPLTFKVISNTIFLLLVLVPLGLLLPFLLGVVLNLQFLKFRGLFRTILFMPVVTSLVVIGIVFRFIFGGEYGWLNSALAVTGVGPFPWTTEAGWAYIPIIVLSVWGGLGYYTLIVLGGLQSLDAEIFEAARVDGANELQIFFSVTLPLMRPVMAFLLISTTIGVMRLFSEPYSLYQGGRGPDDNALTPALQIYRSAFSAGKRYGDAAALGFLLSLVIIVVSIIQYRLTRSKDDS